MYDPQLLWVETVGAITDRIRNSLAVVVVDASPIDDSLWIIGELKYAAAYLIPLFNARLLDDLAPVVTFVQSEISERSGLICRLQEMFAPYRYSLA